MRSFICLLTCLLLLLSLSACTQQIVDNPTEPLAPGQVVNPVRAVDGPEDFTNDLRFYMIPPEEAEDCHYSVIFVEIAQIQFIYDGTEYHFRGSYKEDHDSGVYGPFEETESAILLDHKAGSCDIRLRYTTDGGAEAEWSLFAMHFSLSTPDVTDRETFSQLATQIASSQLDLNYTRTHESLRNQFMDMACDSPITITSCGETHIPYAIGVYSMFWDGQNMICADGGFRMDELTQADILPTVVYGEDFSVTFTSDGELDIIILYDENLQRLDDQWDLDCFSELSPGTYYAEVVIVEYGEYIPEANDTTYSGVSCVFELKVE